LLSWDIRGCGEVGSNSLQKEKKKGGRRFRAKGVGDRIVRVFWSYWSKKRGESRGSYEGMGNAREMENGASEGFSV